MKKVISVIIAIIFSVALTIIIGIGSSAFTNWKVKTWFNNWGKGNKITAPDDTQKDTAQDGIMLLSSTISENDYAAYGVSEQAISAKTLTAEFTPTNATDKRVNWAVAWNNPADSWANGKTVTDYVTLTPAANYAPNATVSVLQSFGESIIVTCTSRANPALSDNCKLEYVMRLNDNQNYEVDLYAESGKALTENKVDFGENTDESESVGAYTVQPNSFKITVELSYGANNFKRVMLPEDYETGDDPSYTYSADGRYLDLNLILRGLLNDVDKMTEYAMYCSQTTGREWFGYYESKIDCYYQGEFIYSITRTGDIYVDESLLSAMSIPATDITVTTPVVSF